MSDATGDVGVSVDTPATPAAETPSAEPTSETPPASPVPEEISVSATEPVIETAEVAAEAEPQPPISSPEPTPPPPPAPTISEKAAVSSAAIPVPIHDRLSQAFEALRFRKRARLDKILQLAARKGRIKNDDVEKLLKVSDSTAQRYLNQLVLEGKLHRSGETTNITYKPV